VFPPLQFSPEAGKTLLGARYQTEGGLFRGGAGGGMENGPCGFFAQLGPEAQKSPRKIRGQVCYIDFGRKSIGKLQLEKTGRSSRCYFPDNKSR
jgi:hypothetical protein